MGFVEVNHAADWAILVWGKDIESLFIDSARGMYSLMGIQPDYTKTKTRSLTIQGEDFESLLVAFLSELLFIVEDENTYFETIDLFVEDNSMKVRMEGYDILSIQKIIKAVTYHNLNITKSREDYQTEIVFDV